MPGIRKQYAVCIYISGHLPVVYLDSSGKWAEVVAILPRMRWLP